MKKILIVFASNAGSTMEIAQSLAKKLANNATEVSVCGLKQAQNLQTYDAIILGAPMMRELHPGLVKYIQKNQQHLADKPVALFITCLRLTDTRKSDFNGIPVFTDQELVRSPQNIDHMTFIERKTSFDTYLFATFESMPWFKPAQIAFFGGALNFRKLKLIQILFVLLLLQFKSVDKRNWNAIKEWSDILQKNLY